MMGCGVRTGAALGYATFEGRKAALMRVGREYRAAMTDWVLHAIGNVGVLFVLGAYFLLSTGKIKAISNWYQGMNLGGAIFLTGYSLVLAAWASVALNTIWAAIAVVSLIINLRRARALTSKPA